MGVFKELKERRLVQIVVTYAAAGWIVLSGAGELVERGVLPELLWQVGLLWYIGGFAIALIVGWFHGEKGRQEYTKPELSMIGLVALVVLVTTGFWVDSNLEAAGVQEARAELDDTRYRRVAVLYFRDDTRIEDDAYLADAFTEALIARLREAPGIHVVSQNGVLPFRGTEAPYDSIAEALRVGTLVHGSVEQGARHLRVDLQVVDGATGATMSRASVDDEPENVMEAMDELAGEAARLLRSAIGEEVKLRSAEATAADMDAWRVFQQGERARKEADNAFRASQPERAAELLARADSLYRVAAAADPRWPDPLLSRAEIAMTRAIRTRGRSARAEHHTRARDYVDRALELDGGSARGYELRGTLGYMAYHWFAHDPDERARMLTRARDDLEQAITFDPELASAQAMLSSLLYQPEIGDVAGAALAARQAYEADAWLRNADDVLNRLFVTNYDLEQFERAANACQEGNNRFTHDPRFDVCRLSLMSVPGADPDPDHAWTVHEELVGTAPTTLRDRYVIEGEFLVGAALARASRSRNDLALADSARAVLERAHVQYLDRHDLGPGLLGDAAWGWVILGVEDRAIDLLKRYAAAEHGFESGGNIGWKWRALRDHPRFNEIVTRVADH